MKENYAANHLLNLEWPIIDLCKKALSSDQQSKEISVFP